ncbi:hypothetical protein BKA24_002732 [Microbacterium marinum]|uniref:Integrase core domain-containing protein n=1 Tax=Microbacterium marinum TaxID=421115 RepID=A0A7W7BSI3_9MICO|nr:hypothetical protein [Microbacterium marinum]
MVNGYYKTELVRGPARSGPLKTVEDLELATLGWVHRHNTQRLHGYLGDVPPVEFDNAFYALSPTLRRATRLPSRQRIATKTRPQRLAGRRASCHSCAAMEPRWLSR